MAEDDDLLAHLDTTAAAAGGPQKKKPIVIIIAIVAILALGGGGYFGYKTYMAKKQAAEVEQSEKEQEKGKEAGGKEEAVKGKGKEAGGKEEPLAVGVMLPLEPFIVNLAGSEGKRFLKVSITLELSSTGLRTEINENIQKVTDSILILLSSKTFEDVYSIQGKFKLKDEIVTRVNRFLLLGHIKDAYFTEFVIQ